MKKYIKKYATKESLKSLLSDIVAAAITYVLVYAMVRGAVYLAPVVKTPGPFRTMLFLVVLGAFLAVQAKLVFPKEEAVPSAE